MRPTTGIVIVVLLALVILVSSSFYTVNETQQVIVTEFGKPVGKPITDAGLHFKKPFVQQVNVLEKRVLEWDGYPNEFQTRDKLFVNVDTYARWRISDPLLFFQSLRDETSAHSRIDDVLDGEGRTAIAKHNLIELIRSSNRQPIQDATLAAADVSVRPLAPISVGREKLSREIFQKASPILAGMGIHLLDLQFKRINYSEGVKNKIYDRMVSERKQIAEKFRAEGQGRAAEIQGQKERDLKKINSEAYKKTQQIRGEADAKATDIYAKAYNQSPQAYDFYQFTKTMEVYRNTMGKDTTLMLSTKGDMFKFLNNIGTAVPGVKPAVEVEKPEAPVATGRK